MRLDEEPSRNRDVVLARQATQPGGIGSLESILGLLKRIKIRALCCVLRTTHCTCNAHPVSSSYVAYFFSSYYKLVNVYNNIQYFKLYYYNDAIVSSLRYLQLRNLHIFLTQHGAWGSLSMLTARRLSSSRRGRYSSSYINKFMDSSRF
jgi:hypothetical protein